MTVEDVLAVCLGDKNVTFTIVDSLTDVTSEAGSSLQRLTARHALPEGDDTL